jgi:hypothetical protein
LTIEQKYNQVLNANLVLNKMGRKISNYTITKITGKSVKGGTNVAVQLGIC